MIKNIYDEKNNYYKHEYFCDYCFDEIDYGEILRNKEAMKRDKIDLCIKCKYDWDMYEKSNKGETNE